jgi:hypothetical protein
MGYGKERSGWGGGPEEQAEAAGQVGNLKSDGRIRPCGDLSPGYASGSAESGPSTV